MKNVIILRSVSGVGKSSFAQLIAEPKIICEADSYFMKNGKYEFDATKLGHAHKTCQQKFLEALDNPVVENIVVSNTNTKPSDYKFYAEEAKKRDIRVTFVVLERRHDGENTHNVPLETLERQHNNLMGDLKLK